MLKVRQAIIVEGRYDRIRLGSVVDATILETGGFRVFHDKDLQANIRTLARTTGIIVMTDSDDAGFRIRRFIRGLVGSAASVTDVYIPQVTGVERRKQAPSAEGILGVEGMSREILLAAFEKAGIGCIEVEQKREIRKADLFDAGLTGAPGSAARRQALLRALGLPGRISSNSMLCILNTMLTYEDFRRLAGAGTALPPAGELGGPSENSGGPD
ncbi:MAG TPA: DUF4093 domain-containing protein [Candidatus Fimivivens faecavium]|nr:DUF4093 domain-containing protein [Candidatus Fimivivens faecavium]